MPRHESRINTGFPKRAPKAQASSGVRGRAPPRNCLDFYSLRSPFLGFRVIQTGYWPDFNLESVFIMKNIFIMKKYVTDFRKTVETGVDPPLVPYKDLVTEKTLKESSTFSKRIKPQTGSHLGFFLPGFSLAYSL